MLFNGCDRNNQERIYRFTIENKSGTAVNIAVFESATDNLIRNISIANEGILSKDFLSSDMDGPPGVQRFFSGDSVTIIFKDSEKEIHYKCNKLVAFEESGCNTPGNILNVGDPKWIREQIGKLYTRTYIFTKEDYENAELQPETAI